MTIQEVEKQGILIYKVITLNKKSLLITSKLLIIFDQKLFDLIWIIFCFFIEFSLEIKPHKKPNKT